MALPLLNGSEQKPPPGRRPGLRAALLGAVAAAALAGALSNGLVSPHQAHAEAAAQSAPALTVAPAASPVSFADVVDHVRDAVVSVKVKITETADASDIARTRTDRGRVRGRARFRIFSRATRSSVSSSASVSRAPPHQFGPAKPHTEQAQGSGFIISSDGYVVTNNHVVEKATDVTLTTDEGKTLQRRSSAPTRRPTSRS